MADETAIGIDLGTSYSCAAIVENGQPLVIPNEWGEVTHASVVSFLENGTTLVGNNAKKNIITHAESTVYSAKRLIGRYYFSDVPFLALWGDKYLPISRPYATFLAEAATGLLPAVSFVDPRFIDEGSGSSGDDQGAAGSALATYAAPVSAELAAAAHAGASFTGAMA